MTIRPISFYLIIKFGIFCTVVNTAVPWYLRGTGSMTPANKNNPQGHISFQGRGPTCSPLLGKVRKLSFSTSPPPKILTLPLYFKSFLVTNNTKLNVSATSVVV